MNTERINLLLSPEATAGVREALAALKAKKGGLAAEWLLVVQEAFATGLRLEAIKAIDAKLDARFAQYEAEKGKKVAAKDGRKVACIHYIGGTGYSYASMARKILERGKPQGDANSLDAWYRAGTQVVRKYHSDAVDRMQEALHRLPKAEAERIIREAIAAAIAAAKAEAAKAA